MIPEEFPETIRLEQVTRVLEGSIVKRLASGQPYGLAVISEGVGMQLAPDSLAELENVERDEHGHIRLAEVPLGRVLRHGVRDGLAELGVKMTIVDKDVGYELRCAPPCAFDLDYTRDLGAGAVRTLLAGGSGVMITRQHAGEIVPIPFEEIVDPSSGKTQVRRVNVGSEGYKSARSLQVRIEREDLEDPKTLEALAGVLGLTPDQTRERYASTV